MKSFLALFKDKGVWATLIGLAFATPLNARLIYLFYNQVEMPESQLKAALIMNIIGICWFMLPSIIEIKSKLFEIIIKD